MSVSQVLGGKRSGLLTKPVNINPSSIPRFLFHFLTPILAVAKIHDNESIAMVTYKRATPSPATRAILNDLTKTKSEKREVDKQGNSPRKRSSLIIVRTTTAFFFHGGGQASRRTNEMMEI
jgi:hypothetical protein